MTSTPPPQQPPGRPVGQVIRPLRDLAAYALVAAPALWLFVAVIRLIPSEVGQDFLTRVQNSFYSFVNVELIVAPLAAVLLATAVQPVHKHARLITIAALIEYAVAGVFAVLFGVLIGLVKIAGFSVRVAFEELLVRAAWLAVFAAAAYAVFLIWRNLFYTPKPKPQPGMYGQPQWQQQPYGQQGYPQPGQPGAPGAPGQPAYPPQPGQQPGFAPQPGQWGQPPAGQGWGAPPSSAPPASAPPAFAPPPASAPPAFAPPASAPPAAPVSGQPAPGTPPGPFAPAPGHPQAPGGYPAPAYPPPGGFADPTQAIPAHQPDDADRTRVVGDDEPPRH